MTNLLDSNVLIALTVSGHEHHGLASNWFDSSSSSFATCPITQGAVLRLLVRAGASSSAAAGVLAQLTGHDRHAFWSDDLEYTQADLRGVRGHGDVTDHYLAALAGHRHGRLVTFDQHLAATFDSVLLLAG